MTDASKLARVRRALEMEKCRRSAHHFVFDAGALFTKDEHDTKDPVKSVPDIPYLRVLLDCYLVSGRLISPEDAKYALDAGIPLAFLNEMYTLGMVLVEKSRDVFVTNLTCCYLFWRARSLDHQKILVQSKKEEDAAPLVFNKEPQFGRMSFMEMHLPKHLRKLTFPSGAAYGNLYFPNGSQVRAIPEGGHIIRSEHPSVIFCVAPSTRVLTRDLRWVEAGSVAEGDELTAFADVRNQWIWQGATVLAVRRLTRPCYRLTFDDGTTVVASAEHKWLVHGTGEHPRHYWRTTESLRVQRGGRAGSRVLRLLNVWPDDRSREAGYLAGFCDGEGHLQQRAIRTRPGWSTKLEIAQNAGPTLDALKVVLKSKGFAFTESAGSSPHRPLRSLYLSRRAEIIEFLGQIRPNRLLSKFDPNAYGVIHARGHARLLAREYVGEQEVVGFQTTTGTFIAEGLASHNSDEAAFQPEFGAAYTAAMPACEGGGQFIAVSSAEPGSFEEIVQPDLVPRSSTNIPGLSYAIVSGTIPLLRIFHDADPTKRTGTVEGDAWIAQAAKRYPGGTTSARWRKEMGIEYRALGGTKAIPQWETWKTNGRIVVPRVFGAEHFRLYGSYDHGWNNPAAFHVHGINSDGRKFTLWEFYADRVPLSFIAKVIKGESVRLPRRDDAKVEPDLREWAGNPYAGKLSFIVADPSLWAEDQPMKDEPNKSVAELFEREGIYLEKGERGGDTMVLEWILGDLWADPENPKWVITANCPWLVWELGEQRFKTLSAQLQMNSNEPEVLVDKHNHAWDGLKMWLKRFPPAQSTPKPAATPGNFHWWRKQAQRAGRGMTIGTFRREIAR